VCVCVGCEEGGRWECALDVKREGDGCVLDVKREGGGSVCVGCEEGEVGVCWI